jgi:hypothetical protein
MAVDSLMAVTTPRDSLKSLQNADFRLNNSLEAIWAVTSPPENSSNEVRAELASKKQLIILILAPSLVSYEPTLQYLTARECDRQFINCYE